jgi:hypothetical protein
MFASVSKALRSRTDDRDAWSFARSLRQVVIFLPRLIAGESSRVIKTKKTRLSKQSASTTLRNLIAVSGLFDPIWYVSKYGVSDTDPLVHCLTKKKRSPGPFFDSEAYFLENQDIAAKPIHPLAHYLLQGRAEGRSVRPADEGRHWEYVPDTLPLQTDWGVRFVAFYWPERPRELPDNNLLRHSEEIRLARRYGVVAFCYYVTDVLSRDLLKEASEVNEFSFCLCIDCRTGLLNDLSEYLSRPNYLRVQNRLLLLVRDAHLDSHFAETARRWREQYQARGIGELLLVGLPEAGKAGVDAVIRLSPKMDWMVKPVEPDKAWVDYRDLVEESYDFGAVECPAFQAVRCGFNNGLAKTGPGILNSSPAAYQEWLGNACRAAVQQTLTEGIVFIDAWNGCARGGALVPNSRYGHAYLNATAMALAESSSALAGDLSVGVIVHAFYEDIWREISDHLQTWRIPIRLYVSVPQDRYEATSKLVSRDFPTALVVDVPNRGRDIAPFLALAKMAASDGVDLICKVHTKRSTHRNDGDQWRRELFAKVLGRGDYPKLVVSAFQRNPAIGMMAPQGHAICAGRFWGANKRRVMALAEAIGYPLPLGEFVFPAGSMFWMRTNALRSILEGGLNFTDFEEERGQTDGTLAHALERLLPIAAKLRGYRVVDTRVLEWSADNGRLRSDLELGALQEPVTAYRFASRHGRAPKPES